jgi:hypothetical protein
MLNNLSNLTLRYKNFRSAYQKIKGKFSMQNIDCDTRSEITYVQSDITATFSIYVLLIIYKQ